MPTLEQVLRIRIRRGDNAWLKIGLVLLNSSSV